MRITGGRLQLIAREDNCSARYTWRRRHLLATRASPRSVSREQPERARERTVVGSDTPLRLTLVGKVKECLMSEPTSWKVVLRALSMSRLSSPRKEIRSQSSGSHARK